MRRPEWDIDKARGEEAEALVRRLRTALANGSCEVKCDDEAGRTGNFFLEYECQTATGWRPSGIQETKATNWVIVFYDMRVMVWMPVWLLRNIARRPGLKRANGGLSGSHPTHGILVPVDDLLSQARMGVIDAGKPKAA